MHITLVVPMLLNIGWIDSPTYFWTVSEMVRDVAGQYVDTPMVSLALHKFVNLTEVNPEFAELPKVDILDNLFISMLEVYMDYYIALSLPRSWY